MFLRDLAYQITAICKAPLNGHLPQAKGHLILINWPHCIRHEPFPVDLPWRSCSTQDRKKSERKGSALTPSETLQSPLVLLAGLLFPTLVSQHSSLFSNKLFPRTEGPCYTCSQRLCKHYKNIRRQLKT